jgi:hypothetical protein
MIKGIPVKIYVKKQTGTDPFGAPVFEEAADTVENVLVYPASADDVVNSTSLYGRKAIYTLGIPKSDSHNWENAKIEFFGDTWRSFGIPLKGIDNMIPGKWNQKVMVERYE